MRNRDFRFGLETEYLLVNARSCAPLWYRDVTFKQLHDVFENISLAGVPSVSGLDLEIYHTKIMPYTVTGYPLFDDAGGVSDFFPKGAEIRTPICNSIETCLEVLVELFHRMQSALLKLDAQATAISHHPTESHFEGPQGNRPHERWQWAMQVMTTYGPDVNISLPDELSRRFDLKDLEAKIDYYAAAMVVLSLASPFYNGQPWRVHGGFGKSYRTFKRSIVAPALRVSGERLEFKSFEMSNDLSDFHNYTLLFLALLLDDSTLTGRANRASRVYELGEVAQFGYEARGIRRKLAELLDKAPAILESWGFASASLNNLWARFSQAITPADRMIQHYYETGGSIPAVMRGLTELRICRHTYKNEVERCE